MATTLNAYLTFDGNCEEAFNFYKTIFGGEFSFIGRFKDMPAEQPVPEELKDKIMHMSLPLTRDIMLMGSDTFAPYSPPLIQGNNITLSVSVETEDEAIRIYNGLSQGGEVIMPLGEVFWAALFGMFTDKYGINWMVNFERKAAE